MILPSILILIVQSHGATTLSIISLSSVERVFLLFLLVTSGIVIL